MIKEICKRCINSIAPTNIPWDDKDEWMWSLGQSLCWKSSDRDKPDRTKVWDRQPPDDCPFLLEQLVLEQQR